MRRKLSILIPSSLRRFVAWSLASFALAATTLAADAPSPKVNFQDHVLPILRNSCLNCHNADKKKADLDISSHGSVMAGAGGSKVIVPGDPDASKLYKVMTHDDEPKMPPKSDKLPAKDLATIKAWIEQGALENSGSKAVAAKPKVDLSVVAPTGKPEKPIAVASNLPANPVVRARRPGPLTALAANPWAPLVAVAGQKQIILYNSDSLDLLGILPFPEGQVQALKFSRSGTILMAAGGQGAKIGKVALYEIGSGRRMAEIGEEYDMVLAADISPDQQRIVLGGPQRMIRLYNTSDGALFTSVKKHTDWVTAVAYSPDGKYFATGDRAGNLYVWEAEKAREVFNLGGHKGAITDLSFRGDSKLLASSSEDGSVRLWKMDDGSTAKNIAAHNGGALSVDFTHDGKLTSAGRDRVVKTWAADGNPIKTFEPLPDIAMHSVFAHDGGRVIGGDWSGAIRVWNAGDAKAVGELSSNPATVAERLAAAQARVIELDAQVKKTAADHAAAQVAVQQATTAAQQAQAALQAAQAAIEKAKADQAAAKQEGAQLKPQLKQAQTEMAQAKNRADAATAALATAQQKLQATADERKAAGEKLVARTTECEAAQAAASAAAAEAEKATDNKDLARKAREAKADVDRLKAKLAEAQAAQAALDQKANQRLEAVKAAQGEVDKHAAVSVGAKKKADDLQAALTANEAKARAAADVLAKTNVADAQKRLDAANAALKGAQEKQSAAKNAADQAAAALHAAGAQVEKLKSLK